MVPYFRNPSTSLSLAFSLALVNTERGISKRKFGAGILLKKCSVKQEAAAKALFNRGPGLAI